mmetsp:Transcript_26461/g.63129  ORF Transcript_26461/g.63129 Transcript_26461/m.63129 type:complete len:123 (-) Transcript_26461:37-405(-)|eukprot:CAMPEP_0181494828 /NCGR_PEP_ID=MMETSP1110-20121109/52023_1 /TAXON_ID=174948 /ORGANISM="Symbiodinium sp., Strain CCMP421" /LENGTH=122 /DNA_ID=CAMNT_0023622353 /DNA_START=32 /DNA_END=400 /DNA_ORIENTATION=-
MEGTDSISPFNPGQLYAGQSTVTVDVDGVPVLVKIDPFYGPQPIRVGGTEPGANDSYQNPWGNLENEPHGLHKRWSEFTITEQKIAVYQTAKINKSRREHAEAWLERLAWEKHLASLRDIRD